MGEKLGNFGRAMLMELIYGKQIESYGEIVGNVT